MAKARVQLRHDRGDTVAKFRETLPWLIGRYKLVILGAASVGKSSLVSHYTKGSYLNVKENTLVASFSSIYLDQSFKFDTWEVAGEERWHSLAHMYYKDAQAALIVYDVQDQESFVCAKAWIKEVRKKLPEDLVVAIAANKVDLWDDFSVSSEELQSYAQQKGYIFMETSAKTGQNINEIFAAMAEELKARPSPKQPNFAPGDCCSCHIL